MHNLLEVVEWWWLLRRVRSDPAKFIERAAWHVVDDPVEPSGSGWSGLMCAAHYVADGQEVPAWLFR
ncbi:MAG TPA: hypothetical protein VNZ03_14830 [Terriglobales bacterium]|jgi:hypothetical protein|nr:hypothetical protein [Terriglobales bacterium]